MWQRLGSNQRHGAYESLRLLAAMPVAAAGPGCPPRGHRSTGDLSQEAGLADAGFSAQQEERGAVCLELRLEVVNDLLAADEQMERWTKRSRPGTRGKV